MLFSHLRRVALASSPFVVTLALAALLAAPFAFAQDKQEPAAAQSGTRIKVDVNLVLLEATVKDKAGHILKDLKKDDFLVYEDGQQQQITHFSRDQLPLAVALVVDLSTSIEPFLRPLRYATLTALKTLKPEDEVALFTFSSDVQRRVELTHDKREASDQIEFFTTGGSTNINGALFEAARYLRAEAPAARRVLILVSDNVPTDAGGVAHKQVLDAVLEADAALYGLKVPGRNPLAARMAAKIGERGMVNVSKLAGETGGEIFDVEKEGSLFLAFQALIERLKTRYTLGYYPTNTAQDGSFRSLDLKLQPTWGAKGASYTVLVKRGYFAPRARRASR